MNRSHVHIPKEMLPPGMEELNGDDIDHAERIREYMIDNQIPDPDESDAGLSL